MSDAVRPLSTFGLQLCNAIYIDCSGTIHEGYIFLNFIDRIDCWDREASEVLHVDYDDDDEDDEWDIKPDPLVRKYVLDSTKLIEIPEQRRRIFQMGGAFDHQHFIHPEIVELLRLHQPSGAFSVPVSEYYLGIEEQPVPRERYR